MERTKSRSDALYGCENCGRPHNYVTFRVDKVHHFVPWFCCDECAVKWEGQPRLPLGDINPSLNGGCF